MTAEEKARQNFRDLLDDEISAILYLLNKCGPENKNPHPTELVRGRILAAIVKLSIDPKGLPNKC